MNIIIQPPFDARIKDVSNLLTSAIETTKSVASPITAITLGMWDQHEAAIITHEDRSLSVLKLLKGRWLFAHIEGRDAFHIDEYNEYDLDDGLDDERYRYRWD